MMRGQSVVTTDGRRWQISGIDGPSQSWAGLETPPAVYTLVDRDTLEQRRVVWETCRPVNTPAGRAEPARFELTPPCTACDVPAGYCYGEGHHYRHLMAARASA